MKTTPDPIATARADVDRLFAAEQELSRRRDKLTASLPVVETVAGLATLESVLNGTDAPSVTAVATARAEVEAIDYALTGVTSRNGQKHTLSSDGREGASAPRQNELGLSG